VKDNKAKVQSVMVIIEDEFSFILTRWKSVPSEISLNRLKN